MTREEQFEAWMQQYGNAVLRTCLLYLSDRAMAEDALQETFLKVWRRMDSYEGRRQASVKTWILTIALNTCRDQRKSAWFRHQGSTVPLEEVLLPGPGVPQEAREMYIDVQRLPARLKEAIVLHHYHQLTKKEAAAMLRISRAALDRRLHKAYRLLGYARKEVPPDEE